ncbi:MAG TPA: hypothetical protein VIU12_21535 [Chryseolinea sp.]
MNKIWLILISAFILLGIADMFYAFDNAILSLGWLLAKIAATWMMLTHGTFVNHRYINLAYGIGAAIGVGLLFKILHYEGADEILIVSLPAMPVLYFIHFLSKKQKQVLDVLKVLTVSLHFIIALLVMMHWMDRDMWVAYLPDYFFWFTFAYYIVLGIQRKNLYV